MDFFQGSLPPNFIPFCLDNQNTDEHQFQTNAAPVNLAEPSQSSIPIPVLRATPNPVPSPPPFPPIRAVRSQAPQMAADSPFSSGSNVDVTAYADEVVQRMEVSRELIDTNLINPTEKRPLTAQVQNTPNVTHVSEFVRTSTPTPPEQSGAEEVSLSLLESTLSVAPQTQSGFPELQLAQIQTHATSAVSFLQTDEDASSFVHEPPPLPGGTGQLKTPGDHSDTNHTMETTSQSEIPLLYATIPFGAESASEGCEGSGSEAHDPGSPGTSKFVHQPQEKVLRDLSGRSRATLKQYFETDDPYTFPVGQRVVAFTEPQVYHLLRVLTDEAINMTCTTMERMVIGAVKGIPVAVPSQAEKFRSRARTPTPGPNQPTEFSSDGFSAELGSGPGSQLDLSTLQDVSDFPYLEDSDNSTERALMDQVYSKTVPESPSTAAQQRQPLDSSGEGAETAEKSSLDVTLSEVRDRLPDQKSRQGVTTIKKGKSKRVPRRGVPMREEFFSKMKTRSFISGPADPLHNPHMVWCHMCKKNFSIKTKGTVEILRHHRTEKHLRRDQRWRYEHLKTIDGVTGKVQHRVRGRDGKILNKIDLAHELPKFIHAELVDVGVRHPFYEDYLKGHAFAPVTPRSSLASVGLTEELGSLSRLLSVISTTPDVVAISGCAVDLIRTVDQHPSYPRGVQSCFRFESLDLRTLMHKMNYSVFGHIDMFSVLQSLLVSLGGCLTEDSVAESVELVRVSLLCESNLHSTGDGGGDSQRQLGLQPYELLCLGHHDL